MVPVARIWSRGKAGFVVVIFHKIVKIWPYLNVDGKEPSTLRV